MILLNRDRDHALSTGKAEAVPDDDAPGRQVQAGRERRGRGDALDRPGPEPLLDESAVLASEPCVVECGPAGHAGRERPVELGRGEVRDPARVLGEGGVLRLDRGRGPLREPLGVPPRVDEDQALAALADRVEAEVQVVGLRGRRVELAAAVVEPDLPAVVDPLPEP